MEPSNRRNFLKHSLAVAGGLGLAWVAWRRFARQGEAPEIHPSLGPLNPVRDLTTGLPILKLPRGFRYHTLAWAGEKLGDGYTSPGACDGMGVTSDEKGMVTLVRNHELSGSSGPFGDAKTAWDNTGGGASTLQFDTASERLVGSWISLNGTLRNCAGGVTPWGTWLSCEEAPVTPELMRHGIELRQRLWKLDNAQKAHGYVFEVEPAGVANPEPIIAMGQFYHEAAAVDPRSGAVYMTEDRSPYAGLYRYLPDIPGELRAGGRLQMLKVQGRSELITAVPMGVSMAVGWADIAEPGQGHTPGSHDGAGVVTQGLAAGATAFVSLEGCAWFDNSIYFTSKAGGDAAAGQVYRLDLVHNTLELVFEAAGKNGFSGMDNIIVSPRGSLMICEDRLGLLKQGQYIAGLDRQGGLFAFCQTNPKLRATHLGHDLHATAVGSEWAGVCFSGDGQWMFANLFSPGMTFAITGPWRQGPV